MKCKFMDIDCGDAPYLMPQNCDEDCLNYWKSKAYYNAEKGREELDKIKALKDQLHRRNALIKKLRTEIREWENGVLHLDEDNQIIKENIYNSINR